MYKIYISINTPVPGVLTETMGWIPGHFMRFYHVHASFIKHLVTEAQTRTLIVESAISIHSFQMEIFEISREKDYSWYPIDAISMSHK